MRQITQKTALITIVKACLVSLSLSVALLFGLSAKASAQNPDPPTAGANCSAQVTDADARCDIVRDCQDSLEKSQCGITRYLLFIINVLAGLTGVAIIGSIVVSGIQFASSGGDPNAAAAAKKRISNAVLAIVAFTFMYGFLQWVVPGGVL